MEVNWASGHKTDVSARHSFLSLKVIASREPQHQGNEAIMQVRLLWGTHRQINCRRIKKRSQKLLRPAVDREPSKIFELSAGRVRRPEADLPSACQPLMRGGQKFDVPTPPLRIRAQQRLLLHSSLQRGTLGGGGTHTSRRMRTENEGHPDGIGCCGVHRQHFCTSCRYPGDASGGRKRTRTPRCPTKSMTRSARVETTLS